jgi:hypothetical protein
MIVDPGLVVMIPPARRHTRRSLARWLGIVVGTAAVSLSAKATQPATAQDVKVPPAHEVPASWQAFARILQLRFQQRLSSDNENVRRLRDTMSKRGDPAASLIVRVWILPDGEVSRVELDEAPRDDTSRDLNAALVGEGIAAVPPDMPQPVRLRLSLRPSPEN